LPRLRTKPSSVSTIAERSLACSALISASSAVIPPGLSGDLGLVEGAERL